MSSVNQWRDTDTVSTWFKNIKNKDKCVFMQYDIEEYYPSVTEDLLRKLLIMQEPLPMLVRKSKRPSCIVGNLCFLITQRYG